MSENKLALVRGSTPLLVVTLPDEIQPSDVYDGIITISQSKFDVAITRQLSDMQFDEGTKTYSSFLTQAETLQLKSGRLTTIQVKLCDNADVVLVSYLYQVEVLPVNNEHVISTDNPSGQPYEVPLNNGVSFCPDVMDFKPQIDLADVITTGDYRLLSHKPSINGVILLDEVSLSDLSLYSKDEVDGIIENAMDAVDARDDAQDTRMDGIDTRLDNQIGDFVLNRTVLADEYTNSQIDNALNGKVDKVTGKQLSTEDYTTAEKTKLADLPSDSELDNLLNGKVDKETGKGLSTNDYTTAEKDKLTALPTKAELDTSLDTKVDKVAGKQLSTEDYTTVEKNKLAGIETGAQVNTVTGVKGDSETDYRTGDINITPANIGLGNVDNTSDMDKPVSTAAQTALDGKVDKVSGKQLSTEDYTTADKTKLTALPDAATLNADLASKADDAVVVKSVNTKTPTSGAVEINAGDIPADGIGDKTVSGNPIVIEDGMASVAKELSVTLEPIQDLHGYESPWIGTDVDKAPYLFRAVSESSVQDKGTHEMDKLIGGTVAFNQLVENGNFADGTTGWYRNNAVTISVSGNILTLTATSESSSHRIYRDINATAFHKYLCHVEVNPSSSGTSAGVKIASNNNSPVPDAPLETDKWNIVDRVLIPTDVGYISLKLVSDNQLPVAQIRNFFAIDLTQMFGSAIADYIYSLEQSTAGSGVAWFRKLFPAPYYPYNSGTLMSVKTSAHITRGFNQWDEEWEAGRINISTGANTSGNGIRSKNMVPVIPSAAYYCKRSPYADSSSTILYWYDGNGEYISYDIKVGADGFSFTAPNNARYLRIGIQTSTAVTYNNDICINISKTTGTPKNGDYVAYDGHSYPLDADLELRGIPKLDSNNKLYYDGDEYESTGKVTRRYGVVDLGTKNWTYLTSDPTASVPFFVANIADRAVSSNFVCSKYVNVGTRNFLVDKSIASYNLLANSSIGIADSAYTDPTEFATAMSGVYLVYELATPTTETADPYTSTQVIDPDGTEEYVDSRTVPIPVGHESNYANICPIEGRTGTEVQRTGKNLWNPDMSLIKQVSYYTSDPQTISTRYGYEVIVPPGTYVANAWFKDTQSSIYIYGGVYESDGHRVTVQNLISGANPTSQTLIVGNGQKIMYYNGPDASIEQAINSFNKVNIQLEIGSTATEYAPYSPDTASVTFGQTVYGGQVDFNTGVLTVTHGVSNFEDFTWTFSSQIQCFRTTITTRKAGWISIICSSFKVTRGSIGISDMPDHSIKCDGNQTTKNVFVKESAYSDATTFVTAMTGQQICYELETPQTVQLTPAQLTLLQGTNILTADGQINLTYLGSMASNVQDEIDEFESGLNNVIGSIAFIENTTAKTSHAVGDYVILNGIFCKVIASISAGETLSFGTNIQATTIGAELKAIWAQISN